VLGNINYNSGADTLSCKRGSSSTRDKAGLILLCKDESIFEGLQPFLDMPQPEEAFYRRKRLWHRGFCEANPIPNYLLELCSVVLNSSPPWFYSSALIKIL
jgi:hypothetical protein